MLRTWFWFAGIVLLLASRGAGAAVDGWVLALSWQPGYCVRHAGAAECGLDRPVGLVLHGLWPESENGVSEFCDATLSLRQRDVMRTWCELPAPALSEHAAAILDSVMPGRIVCLDRHEWFRHGSCSAMEANNYFTVAAALVDRVNGLALGQFLRQHAGTEVSGVALSRAAARIAGLEGSRSFSFICSMNGNTPHLSEVWIAMTSIGPWLFPKREALQVQRSPVGHRCPIDGTILIDGKP